MPLIQQMKLNKLVTYLVRLLILMVDMQSLTKNGEIIDLIGVIGEYPPDAEGWWVNDIIGTANNTLIRDYSVDSPSSMDYW